MSFNLVFYNKITRRCNNVFKMSKSQRLFHDIVTTSGFSRTPLLPDDDVSVSAGPCIT